MTILWIAWRLVREITRDVPFIFDVHFNRCAKIIGDRSKKRGKLGGENRQIHFGTTKPLFEENAVQT